MLTVARFCAQRSELAVAEHWYERTALADLTGIPLEKINEDRLYRGLDVPGCPQGPTLLPPAGTLSRLIFEGDLLV